MDLPSDTNYVDVSAQFAQSVSSMPGGRVALVPNFDMLEGARALEVGNPKLDTGAIQLSQEELTYDSCAPQTLAQAVALMDRLLVLYMTWINGQSLSVSVLSCRYMVDLLESYKNQRAVSKTSFVSPRLHGSGKSPHDPDSVDVKVVNVLLRAYALAIAKTIGFSTRVATEVLYDEEDLVTRNMGYDFLTQVSVQIVEAEINEAELWLYRESGLSQDPAYSAAGKFLKIAKYLISLENVLSLNVRLFEQPEDPKLAGALELVQELQNFKYENCPPAAFSTFVQLDCGNKHIPAANVTMDRSEAYRSLSDFLRTVNDMVVGLSSLQNAPQLENYLRRKIGVDTATTANALARGIFQLFLIRDDRSLMGSDEDVGQFGLRIMENISLCRNSIMDPQQWNVQHTDSVEATTNACLSKLQQLLNEIEAYMYQKLSLCGNNRSRQRQLLNRTVLLLDQLQFNSENTETELFAFGVGDKLSPTAENQPALGITSFLYLEKLDVMVELVLTGFEQELYRNSEASLMYWYAAELCAHAHQHIGGRIVQINEGKLASIKTLAKKIKKTKAGDKKEALKASYKTLNEHTAPIVTANAEYMEKYLALEKLALMELCLGVSTAIDVLEAVSKPQDTSDYLASQEQLFRLRMKPWSSVGTPEMPRYESYEQKRKFCTNFHKLDAQSQRAQLKYQVALANVHFSKCKETCEKLRENMEKEAAVQNRLVVNGENVIGDYYKHMVHTANQYIAQLTKVDLGQEYRMVNGDGPLKYFPIYSLEKKLN